jgi:hypothetical protein
MLDRGDLRLFNLELGEIYLNEILKTKGIVPSRLHRNLLIDKLKANTTNWICNALKELDEEFRNN